MSVVASKKIAFETKALISQMIRDVLDDPDFGLELSDNAKKRLVRMRRLPQRTVSFSAIKKKYY